MRSRQPALRTAAPRLPPTVAVMYSCAKPHVICCPPELEEVPWGAPAPSIPVIVLHSNPVSNPFLTSLSNPFGATWVVALVSNLPAKHVGWRMPVIEKPSAAKPSRLAPQRSQVCGGGSEGGGEGGGGAGGDGGKGGGGGGGCGGCGGGGRGALLGG